MMHVNGNVRGNYGRDNRTFDPNFKFCTFCKNDSSRRDNLRFSHWVCDKQTGVTTCPFLLNTVFCDICLEAGHTTGRCRNGMKIHELQMACMTMNPDDDIAAKMARLEFEDEMMRRQHVAWYRSLEKSCAFCANYGDGYHTTHTLGLCPRLACMTCKHCGEAGHTISRCLKKGLEDEMKKDTTHEFILDFDMAEREDAIVATTIALE